MPVQTDRHQHRRFSRSGGFSLIELVSVMIIVGILSGAAIVSLSAATGNREAVAARQLVRDLTFARQWAVATGTRSWVQFDDVNEWWQVLAEIPSNPGRANAVVMTDPATGDLFVQNLNTDSFLGVTLFSAVIDGEKWVGFDWLGRPLDFTDEVTPLPANGLITFDGAGYQVSINKDTGHVTLVMP